MSLTKLPTVSKVFLALVILGLTTGVLPGQPKEAPKTITVPAQIQSFETVEIYSLVTGQLKKQTVDIGARVAKGQILAEIDAPILVKEVHQAEHALDLVAAQLKVVDALVNAAEASVKEARSRIEQREAELLATKSNLKGHLQELKRYKELGDRSVIDQRTIEVQVEKVVAAESGVQAAQAVFHQSKNDMLVKMALVEKARAEVDVQRARIRAHGSALDIAKNRVTFTKILAPFDGVITRRQFGTGELIRAADHGRPLPLFVLQRVDRMRVIVQIPPASVAMVHVGGKVELTIPFLADPIQGTIARTAVAIEEGTMRAEMDVVNTGNLRPGMTGRATIQLEKAK